MGARAGAVVFLVSVSWLAWNRAGVEAEKPETLVLVGREDQDEMDAARDRARREVGAFVAALRAGDGNNFGVKATITDAGRKEHFWLTDVEYRDGTFFGRIDNEPGIVQNVKIGQEWSVAEAEIADWMFIRAGKMHGNYTMRPLLKRLPEAQAAKLRSMLAEP